MVKYRNLEQLANENIITRPFKKAIYALNPQRVVLDQEHYAHVINRRSGEVETVEGPVRRKLNYDEKLVGGIQKKLVLEENKYVHIKNSQTGQVETVEGKQTKVLKHGETIVQGPSDKYVINKHSYILVHNPVDSEGIQHFGDREVRVGPVKFALHDGEVASSILEKNVLSKYSALLTQATSDFDGHKAGDSILTVGPQTYVPSKHELIEDYLDGVPLSDTEGIYVQNKDTGDARLVSGLEEDIIYFLQPNEKLFEKELTDDELQALGLKEQQGARGVRILTRQAANSSFLENTSNALVLELEDNEVVQIFDGSDSRIEKGPKTTFLGPYERPKVLNLSGGKPIQQGALKVALLKQGPDFIYDRINVRTKDNAQLNVDLSYKWKFDLADDELKKAFSIDDFVGYAAETLSSEIRSVAAKHDFEDFHGNALSYVTDKLFDGKDSRRFDENGLQILGVDITGITPEDPQIAKKLHQAIERNMDIYCDKLILKATLESERQKVEGQLGIAAEKKKLIEAQNVNERLSTIERTKIKTEAEKVAAQGAAEALEIRSKSEADAERVKLQAVINEVGGTENYLTLQRAKVFEGSEKLVVVPTDSKLVLPHDKNWGGD